VEKKLIKSVKGGAETRLYTQKEPYMKSRFIIILTILALSLSACASLAEDITPPPDANHPAPEETVAPAEKEIAETEESAQEADTQETDADGESLFNKHCAECHNKDGSGEGNSGADLTDAERLNGFPDKMIGALILKGNSDVMPPINANLNDFELGALIAYVRELSGKTPNAELDDDGSTQAEDTFETEDEVLGDVNGLVTNGTGGDLPKNLTVQLEIYEHDMMTGDFNVIGTFETEVEEDGTYIFEDMELVEGHAFLSAINDDGVIYTSQPNFITENSADIELPIIYYEKSSDTSELAIDRLHVFFEPPNNEEEIAHVVEVFVVSNPSLYAIVPEDDEAVVEFLLPEGANNIQFEDGAFGDRYIEIEGGFGDTAPILPGIGAHEVVVFFDMPYEKKFLVGNSLDFTQKIEYPTDSVIVMVPKGLEVESDLLTESGERESQGLVFVTYSSPAMPAEATFEMKVSGEVSMDATGTETNSEQNMLYGLFALGVVLIGAGTWFYLRDRGNDNEDDYDDAEMDDADELMDAIIALDDAHRVGDISDEVYQNRRAALKKQLKELA